MATGNRTRLTDLGGIAVRLVNRTGATSIKGTLVEAGYNENDSFNLADADDRQPMGCVEESGILDGEPCWVVISGIADVLIKDGTTATRGYWACASSVPGRADITNENPPGNGVAQHNQHFKEIGHCLQSAAAGTDVLVRIVMHFN